jgi:alkylation response protein AidB-like acyl-CoA dehydrogenase
MRMEMETTQLVTHGATEMLDAGAKAATETAIPIAKVVETENNFKVSDLGMLIMRLEGCVQGDAQRLVREARMGMISGGTNEIPGNANAKRVGV